MNKVEITEKLMLIFRDVFDDEGIMLSEKTTPEDIENWDSIGHVYLTADIEDEFSIELGEEMSEIENVGDIIDIIIGKINTK